MKNLHPSKHTTIKDWKFGLGLGKDPDIVDMMAAKYPEVAAEFEGAEAEYVCTPEMFEETDQRVEEAAMALGKTQTERSP